MKQILLAVLLLFGIWDAVWWVAGVKPVFPWQLQERLRTGAAGLVLLDVRIPPEYHWFHLPGALNVPELLMDSSRIPPIPLSQEMVVICMTGHRSPLVAYALKKRGYPRVYHLTGGMAGYKVYEWVSRLWRPKDRPTTRRP
jgi:rhodanese-related sulfurtransferase